MEKTVSPEGSTPKRSKRIFRFALIASWFAFTAVGVGAMFYVLFSGDKDAMHFVRPYIPIFLVIATILISIGFFRYLGAPGSVYLETPFLKMKFRNEGNEIDRANDLPAEGKEFSTARVYWVARARLLTEVEALRRRANVNLFIGIGTTVVAVSILVWTVFTSSAHNPITNAGSDSVPAIVEG